MSSRVFVMYVILGAVTLVLARGYHKEKEERKTAERNITALTSDIETYKTKSNEQAVVIKGLELDKTSLENVNKELYDDLSDTKVKLKHAESAIRVVTEYKYVNKNDTIHVFKSDSITKIDIDNKYLKLKAIIDNYNNIIRPSNFILSIPNKQTIATEVDYKGWWLFKRKKGVSVTIVNSNPYYDTLEGFYVKLK